MYPRIMIHRKHIKGRLEYYGDRSYHSLVIIITITIMVSLGGQGGAIAPTF